MTAEALSRPVCTATIGETDVTVTVDGIAQTFESMNEAISYLAGTADDLGRPLKVMARDPSSQQPETLLIISSDGSVAEEPSARNRKRPLRRPPAATPAADRTTPAGQTAAAPAEQVPADPAPAAVPPPAPIPADDGKTSDGSGEVPGDVQGEVSGEGPRPGNPGADAAAPAGSHTVATPLSLPETTSERSTGDRVSEPAAPESGARSLQLRRETAPEKAPAAAREGWRGWVNAAFNTRLAASPAERRTRDRRTRIQRPLNTHMTAATLQLKGGGTKTTVTYYLAATYGRLRGGNILAGEVNENQGTLAERAMSAGHERSTLDLIRNLSTVTRRTSDLVRYVRPQGDDRIHVLASPPEGADRRRVDGSSVKAAHDVLRSLYNLILLDTGNSAQASTWRAAVEVADALVFVAQNKEDDCRLLEATVEAVRAEGHAEKLPRSILVVTNTAHPNIERMGRLKDYARAIGLAQTIVVPFDPSLQEGRAFDYEALAPATRRAYEEATAALTDQL